MERFEAVSKLLFAKIVDEREAAGTWNGSPQKPAEELRETQGLDDRRLYEKARAIWQRAIAGHPDIFAGDRARFHRDIAGVAKIVRLLDGVSLSQTSNDIKGPAYEELLRNTFEKNENQQYFTPRHVADFMVEFCDPKADEEICDPAAGSGGFLVGSLLWVLANGEQASAFSSRLTGADVDERMAWVARINMLMHGGDPRSIHHIAGSGALSPLTQIRRSLPGASFDLILTNPPFGSDLTDARSLRSLTLGKNRASRRRGALFVERSLELLRPGGRLAIILDDSLLNLPSNQDARSLIQEEAIVEAVISLPEVTFMPYSTAKSSILVLRRRTSPAEKQGSVFMADVEQVGNRPNGDPLYADEYGDDGSRKLLSDLPATLDAYRKYRRSRRLRRRVHDPTVFLADLDMYSHGSSGSRLDVFFYHPARQEAQARLRDSPFPLAELQDVMDFDTSAISPAEEYGDSGIRWIGLAGIEAETGRYVVSELPGDRIRSSARCFRGGDILFSRLRPKLRKVVLIPDDDEGGFCSSELLVLRSAAGGGSPILPELLAYLLRSDLAYGQLIYQITGVGRPRVGANAVRRLQVPVPPVRTQRRLLRTLLDADRDAGKLRSEARRQSDEASHVVEGAFDEVLESLTNHSGSRSSGVGDISTGFEPARNTASA
jgi:type I restriction enzyme M protein